MLQEKTRGNLTIEEQRLLENSLTELRFRYVQAVEDKGKPAAALMPANREPLRIIVLGSGTSVGVPTIGCRCEVCLSLDPRDNRLRPSVLVQYAGRNVLVDTTPDFRLQALRAGIDHLDAILFTHAPRRSPDGARRRASDQHPSAAPRFRSTVRPSTIAAVRRCFGYAFDGMEKESSIPKLESSTSSMASRSTSSACESRRCRCCTADARSTVSASGTPPLTSPTRATFPRSPSRSCKDWTCCFWTLCATSLTRPTRPWSSALEFVEKTRPAARLLHAHLPRPGARDHREHAAAPRAPGLRHARSHGREAHAVTDAAHLPQPGTRLDGEFGPAARSPSATSTASTPDTAGSSAASSRSPANGAGTLGHDLRPASHQGRGAGARAAPADDARRALPACMAEEGIEQVLILPFKPEIAGVVARGVRAGHPGGEARRARGAGGREFPLRPPAGGRHPASGGTREGFGFLTERGSRNQVARAHDQQQRRSGAWWRRERWRWRHACWSGPTGSRARLFRDAGSAPPRPSRR